jgi:hypothetical protein
MINLPDNFIEVKSVYLDEIRYVNIDQITNVIPIKREECETEFPYCRIYLARNDCFGIEIKMTAKELFDLIRSKREIIELERNDNGTITSIAKP